MSTHGTFPLCGTCGLPYRRLQATGECQDCYDTREAQEYVASGRARRDWMAAAGVPTAHRVLFDPDRLQVKPEDARAMEWWDGKPSLVTLTGKTGTGKTTYAVELAFRLQLAPTRFIPASILVDSLFDEGHAAKGLAMTRCLVIDDLGVGHGGKTWEYLMDFVSKRGAWERVTIITTMLNLNDIPNEALADRMRAGRLVHFQGRSQR